MDRARHAGYAVHNVRYPDASTVSVYFENAFDTFTKIQTKYMPASTLTELVHKYITFTFKSWRFLVINSVAHKF